MKKIFKRTLATIMVVLMLLTSAPLQGFIELEWPELDFSGVGDWFAGKASAADEKLTAEEAVDIFMNYKNTWMFSKIYAGQAYEYFFIDLDFDGILELVSTEIGGTGYYSVNKVFKIDEVGKKVYEVSSDIKYDVVDFALNTGSPVKLYKTPDGINFYMANSLVRAGWMASENFEKVFLYNKDSIIYLTVFGIQTLVDTETYKESKHYFITNPNRDFSIEEVSYSDYVSFRNVFFNSCTNLNLKTTAIDAETFNGYSIANKTKTLLDAYKAFDYDGRAELDIQDDCEVYLGDRGEGYVNDSNSIHASYKGDVKKFNSAKVKFTVADSSIAEIKNVKALNILGNSIDIYGEVITKKIGETKVTLSYDNVSVSGKLTVKNPNEFKLEIEEPNLKYFEIDGVFFDDSNYLSADGISLEMKYSNAFLEGVDYEISDAEILKQLKYKDAKIVFEIEEGAGLSLENSGTVNKKEIEIEELYFLEEVEDKLQIFCTDSDALGKYDAVNAKIKYSVMLLENGEYVEKASDYIEFEVQSYKMHYIKEHNEAMKNGSTVREMFDNSFARQMVGIEDTKDFKFVQFLNDGLIKSIADACGTIDEQQAYQLMIADLVSVVSSGQQAQSKEIFSGALLQRASDILDVLVAMVDAEGFGGEEMRTFIASVRPEALVCIILGTQKSEKIEELFNYALESVAYKNRLAKVVGNTEIIGKICKVGGFGLGVASDFFNIIKAYNQIDTVMEMFDEQTYILEDLKHFAESAGDEALADALDCYIDYENSFLLDDIIRSCVNSLADNTVDGIVSFAGGIFAKLVKEKITNFTAEKVLLVAGSVVSGVLAGVELGGFVSDLLCNSGSYGAASLKIVLAGHISQSLRKVILDYYSKMASGLAESLDLSFEYAQKLDCALKLFQELELTVCRSTIDGLEARATSAALQTFFKWKFDDYRQVISDVRVRELGLCYVSCHDITLSNIYAEISGASKIEIEKKAQELDDNFAYYKTLCVQCPVDVIVRDSKGNVVASVENNVVTKKTDGIGITVIEDEKFITLPSTDEYDVEIIATDEGAMDYTVYEYSTDNYSNVRGVSYESVPLTKNKEFTAKLDTEKFTDKNNYNLATGSQTITPTSDDYVPLTAISLDGNKVNSLYVNNEITLSVATTPENASAQSYKWTSSDESIATVSGGIVRGKKAGTVTITCELKSNSSIKDTITVTVNECSHSYSLWETVEESTCDKYGYKKRNCSVCNVIETEAITELKPHEAESTSYSIPASCTKNASTITLCKNCGEECNKVETPNTAIGHKLGAVNIDEKATTEKSGSQSQKCSTCGSKVNITKIPRVITPSLAQTSFIFDAKAKTPKLTIKDIDGNILEKNVDYTLKTDSGRIKPGTYKSVVTLIGKYEGTVTLKFTVAMQKTTVTATQSTSTIKLTWTAVTAATGYRVYYQTESGWKLLGTTSKLTATFKNLKAGAKYTFAVQPISKVNGEEIRATNFTTIDTAVKTVAPSRVTATQSTSAIKLSWAASAGADGYKIFYKLGGKWKATVNSTTATSHTFKSLKAGVKYTFAIQPYVKTESGVIWGEYAEYVAATIPSTVTAKATSGSSGKIALSWNTVSGSEGYRVYYKTGNGSFKLYKTVSASTNSLSFSGLKSGTKYTFAVRAGIKTTAGNIFGGYNTATVTVK